MEDKVLHIAISNELKKQLPDGRMKGVGYDT